MAPVPEVAAPEYALSVPDVAEPPAAPLVGLPKLSAVGSVPGALAAAVRPDPSWLEGGRLFAERRYRAAALRACADQPDAAGRPDSVQVAASAAPDRQA